MMKLKKKKKITAFEQEIVHTFNGLFFTLNPDYNTIARMVAMVKEHRNILEKYSPKKLKALGVYPGEEVSSEILLQNLLDTSRNCISSLLEQST